MKQVTYYFYNDNDGMREVNDYAEAYGFEATLIHSYYDEGSGNVDKWKLVGEEENIEAFIEDYGLDEVIER